MTTAWKRVWMGVAALAAVAVVCAVLWVAPDQVASYLACRRLEDPGWHETATPKELRVTAEQAIGWRFDTPHDAFLILLVHGDQSSVPYLRAALRRKPSGDSVSCAWGHCEEALEHLTSTEHHESGDD